MTSGKLGPRVLRLLPLLGILAAGVVAACSPPAAATTKDKKANPSANANDGDDPDNAGDPSADGDSKTIQSSAQPFDPNAPTNGAVNAANNDPAQPPPATPLTKRCAVRLSIALSGKSPDASIFGMKEVAPTVEKLVASPDFAERYARFINSEFNGAAGKDGGDDPVYYLAKFVITNEKPWTDLFNGPYAITASADSSTMNVTTDAGGLGYFRSSAWMHRYAGNEEKGMMLSGAFRIFSNTTGLELVPSVGNPGDDRTATGRKAAPCKTCHFDLWFALDTAAKLLPRKQGKDDNFTFARATDGPQQLLGKTLADDKALVNALVDSDAWRFAQCRTVFKFLYGRPENKCESVSFDRCVDALVKKKTIRAAVSAVASDPAVCK